MSDFGPTLAGSKAFADRFIPFLLTGVAVVAGLALIYSALRAMYDMEKGRAGGGREITFFSIAIKLLVGAMMLRLGSTVEDVSFLVTGTTFQSYNQVLAYAPLATSNGAWNSVLQVVLLWVVMLGWLGAFRGLLLWNEAANGGASGGSSGDSFFRGFWHLLGGAAAVNLSGFINAFLSG